MKYLLILILLVSCNPVKQVLGDKDKFDKVAAEVIRRGYCINDTVRFETIKDSIVFKDSIIKEIKDIPCKDFDTTIGRARIRVSSGVLFYTAKDSLVYRTKIITNHIRDVSKENILVKDIAQKDSVISSLKISIAESKLKTIQKDKELIWWEIKFWLVIVSAFIITFRKSIFRFIV